MRIFQPGRFYPQTSFYKDNVPITQQSMAVQHINDRMLQSCVAMTVGTWAELPWDYRIESINTFQSQSTRNNYLPKFFLNASAKKAKTSKVQQCDSAIVIHLLQSKDCANNYNDHTIFHSMHGKKYIHFSTLEATYIKTLKPILYYVARKNSSTYCKIHISWRLSN